MTVRLIKLAVVYLVIGMTLGVGMGMSHNFLFRSVHAHVNLLGWVSLALAALVFHVFPETARTRLATVWFWTYNVCFPVGLGGLALVMAGHTWAEPALIGGQLGIWASGLMFAVNVFWALRAKQSEPATMAPSPATAR
jgi:hypothetical protein